MAPGKSASFSQWRNTMDAKQTYEAFKAAKADPSKTNAEIVTQVNKLYEKMRLAKKAGEAEQKLSELAAENAKLKAQLEGKGKAAGKAA
jgi:phage replication-related protein YjqB (UPF0714/DUF867 family)